MRRPDCPRPVRGLFDCQARSRSQRSQPYERCVATGGLHMKVLLAGAAGFVGSHLAERMIADGHHVIGVDNFITGHEDNLVALRRGPRFEFIRADVSEPLEMRGIDGVLHLASPASPVDYLIKPIETLKA